MVATPRMRKASEKHAQNITKRGLISAPKEESSNINPYLLGLFAFVVVGSALFQVIQSVRSQAPPS
eukprot:m.152138 g.152138  ORF g.152138 m.152138 type:complete len:66 (+) comp52848_c0_seq1:1883-2080(+)